MQARSAVLFVNGDYAVSRVTLSKIVPSAFLVAVDGGLNQLIRIGKLPNLLIGDLDSITDKQVTSMHHANVEIKQFPKEKDETDLELALLELVSRKFKKLRIVGGMGKRIDHTLGNISLLSIPGLQNMDVRLVDDACEIFLVKKTATIKGKPNDRISLLPLFGPVLGITTKGLEYPLKNETLHPENTRGISNVMTLSSCAINFTKGKLICIHYFNNSEKSGVI
jgi:thiamine pyrophosphokinase